MPEKAADRRMPPEAALACPGSRRGPRRRHGWVLALGLLALSGMASMAGCNAGAYPNDLFNEMHYQPSQRRLEPDRLSPPDDAVPVTGAPPARTFADASRETNPVPVTPQTMQRAQALYTTNCAMCHGADGHGKSLIAAYFAQSGATVPPVDLSSDRVRGRTDGELHWIIENGLGGMPAFRALLADDDVWRLVAFIRSLQGS